MHPLHLFALLFVPGIKCSEGVLQDIFKRNGGEGYPFSSTDVTPIEEPKTVGAINPSKNDEGQLKPYQSHIAKNNDFSLSLHPRLRMMDFLRFQDSFLRHLLPKGFIRRLQTSLNRKNTEMSINRSRSNYPSNTKMSECRTIWRKNKEGQLVPCGYVIRVIERPSINPINVAKSEDIMPEKNISFGSIHSETTQKPIKKLDEYKPNLNPVIPYKTNLNLNIDSPSTADQNISVDETDQIRSFTDDENIENKIICFIKKYPQFGDNKYFLALLKGKENSLTEKEKLENNDAAIDQRKDSSQITTSPHFLQNLYVNNKNSDNQRAKLMDQNSDYRKKISENNFDATSMKLSHTNGPIEKTFEVNLDIKPINENSLFENSETHSFIKMHADNEIRNDINTGPLHFSLGKTRSAASLDHESQRRISKRDTYDDMYIANKNEDAGKQNLFRNNIFDSRNYAESFENESEENEIPDNLDNWNHDNHPKFHGIYLNPMKEQFFQKHRENKLQNDQSYLDMIKFINNEDFIVNKDISTYSKEEPLEVDKKLKESSSSENLSDDVNNQTNATVVTSDYTQEMTNEPSLSLDQTSGNSPKNSNPSIIPILDSHPATDKEGLFSSKERKIVQTDVKPFVSETDKHETCPHLQELLFWNNVFKNILHLRAKMSQLKEILP